ncbi:MAG: hypothetical protein CO108_18570 [Deltaproteobacteria bacterium CG_4_9_14_3_um_filter_63_12]|nr:MAG: hypothetical protein COW42_16285 [Deltaproteobacteria bacterium CG17_big_fil_post_rev_8_21_14_2_50_63_7]PJB38693.1 MAG: hypothetical protein CO108_18570 [Deltaproteobacteria bacterium CG_4_9_14_3_um_filter_63_12]
MRLGTLRRVGIWLAMLFATGCGSAQYGSNIELPVAPPDGFSAAGQSRATAEPLRWWMEFGSAELNATVEEAFDGNFDLLVTRKRLEQLEAVQRMQSSAAWPNVEAQASVGRSKTPGPRGALESDSFVLGVAAAYEIDVWGKTRAAVDAAELDILSTRENLDAAAALLVAQIVEQWASIVHQRAKRKLLEAQLKTSGTFLELALLRLSMGQNTALDVLQQRQLLEALQSQLVFVETAETLAQHKLAVLIGRTPGVVIESDETLPEIPEAFEAGIPDDLLQQRPDVRSARLSAQAADARIVVAMADRLPSVRLSASLSLMAQDPVDLLDDFFWNLAVSLAAPLFDGGRRSAEVDRVRAVLDEKVLLYGKALLLAIEEVESALLQERQQRKVIADLELQLATASAILGTAQAQYLRGVSTYYQVLIALRTTQQMELGLLDAQRQLVSARIQLYRAVGGTWTPFSASIDEERKDDEP